jgi:hypothetical protein
VALTATIAIARRVATEIRPPDATSGRAARHGAEINRRAAPPTVEVGGTSALTWGAMGQPVAVVEKPSTTPGVVRLELNRSLTGWVTSTSARPTDAIGPRPAAELARRLFATDRVDACTCTPTW